jgi:hypothetical protein
MAPRTPVGLGADAGYITSDGSVNTDALIQQGAKEGIKYAQSTDAYKHIAATSATGITIGTLVAGPIGAAIGAVLGALQGLGDLLAAAMEHCTIAPVSPVACKDYPNNVAIAAQWVKDHADQAVHMRPEDLAISFNLFLGKAEVMAFFQELDRTSPGAFNDDLRKIGILPGARELLQMIQVPAAAALAAATPALLPIYRTTYRMTFPTLTDDQLTKIFATTQPLHDALVARAQDDANTSFQARPTAEQVHQRFPMLLPADTSAIVDQWNERLAVLTPEGMTRAQRQLNPPMATATKVLLGTAVVAGGVTIALAIYAHVRHLSFVAAAKQFVPKRILPRAHRR